MSDDWGDLDSLPEPKRGIPRWLWACGCGCLLIVILLGSGTFWAVGWVREGMNPERVREGLAEVVQFDELPEGFQPLFGREVPFMDMGFYVLRTENESTMAVFFHLPGGEEGEEARKDMLEDGGAGTEPFDIEVQGRTVKAVHVTGNFEGGGFTSTEVETEGNGIMVDLTGADGRPVLLLYSHASKEDPVPVEDLVEFLRPFHVGPDR